MAVPLGGEDEQKSVGEATATRAMRNARVKMLGMRLSAHIEW
jgi:hypothetical protein